MEGFLFRYLPELRNRCQRAPHCVSGRQAKPLSGVGVSFGNRSCGNLRTRVRSNRLIRPETLGLTSQPVPLEVEAPGPDAQASTLIMIAAAVSPAAQPLNMP